MTKENLKQEILLWLKNNVPESRIKHTLGVEEMAIDLAKHYNLDVEKASKAALMHDLAKYYKPQLLLEKAKKAEYKLDEVEIANPHLLHAEISAIVAQEEFKIEDEEILEAIRNHTLGRPEMSLLSCIIFVADTLELGRGETAELQTLRQKIKDNIYQGVWLTCDYSLKYLLDSRCLIHPRTILTRNWAIMMAKKS